MKKQSIDWPQKDSENPPKKFELYLLQMEDSKKRIQVLSKIKKIEEMPEKYIKVIHIIWKKKVKIKSGSWKQITFPPLVSGMVVAARWLFHCLSSKSKSGE